MMHLSRTRSFQPEAPGGMGSAEPLCLPSRRSTRSSCPRRALGLALWAPALLLLAREVFVICPSSGVQKSTLLTFGKHLAKCLLLLLAHKHQVGFGTGFGEKKKTFPGMTPPGPLAIISGQPFCSDQEFSHVPRSNFQMTFKHRT